MKNYTLISISEFKSIWEIASQKPTIAMIDVRTPTEFKEVHVPGVHNLPLDKLSPQDAGLNGANQVYILCKSGTRSCKAAKHLASEKREIIVVDGGTDAWIKAEYPTQRQAVKIPLMRQVFIVASSLVLIGTLGSLFLHEYFIYLAIFAGGGLMLSGLTGWCGMAKLLGVMPWNR